MELHERATKRESLAALSLAFATPRPTQYNDLVGYVSPTPAATLPRAARRSSRPGTAPPQASSSGKSKADVVKAKRPSSTSQSLSFQQPFITLNSFLQIDQYQRPGPLDPDHPPRDRRRLGLHQLRPGPLLVTARPRLQLRKGRERWRRRRKDGRGLVSSYVYITSHLWNM